jgi:HSP20 family protein
MAEVNVEKKRSDERAEQKGIERRQSSVAPGRDFPSLFSRGPADIFNVNPFTFMKRMSDDMERLFSSNWPGWGATESTSWSPNIEVTEREGQLRVYADLPGLNKEDVKVEVTPEGLVIQGERKREHEEHEQGYHRSERSYGAFYRRIPLPESAKVDQARAEFHNGVLEVSIPVPEERQKRVTIPIETGGERKPATSEAASGTGKSAKAG